MPAPVAGQFKVRMVLHPSNTGIMVRIPLES